MNQFLKQTRTARVEKRPPTKEKEPIATNFGTTVFLALVQVLATPP